MCVIFLLSWLYLVSPAAATSTTTTAKTSSHVTRCSDSQRNYCVNGGECFTLEIMPGSTKFLCRYDMDSIILTVYVTTTIPKKLGCFICVSPNHNISLQSQPCSTTAPWTDWGKWLHSVVNSVFYSISSFLESGFSNNCCDLWCLLSRM